MKGEALQRTTIEASREGNRTEKERRGRWKEVVEETQIK